MNNPIYTDRQIALQAAVEMSKNSSYINNSFDVVAVAERFRKFLEEGIVEQKDKPVQTQGTYSGGFRPRVGNG
jgi:hypothetical protein